MAWLKEIPMSEEKPKTGNKLVAIILVRGLINVGPQIKDTINMLRLRKKHACVVIEETPAILGMVKKAKDYITWGRINEETLKLLVEKRGKVNPDDKNRTKPFFNLHPPRGGFERKGIKTPFTMGGVLGDRNDKINELIKKML